ncbi:F-box only protein 6-like isoform X1 [Rhynchophorus ferrugineus]|uniref:F-box only protein 6-like isoform X1 n=1 Tax=Rhynchophorus ferrugineus TaxID=354439 RepID=UPI003FCDEF8D
MEFHDQFNIENNSLNGLELENIYVPEDVIINILKYLEPNDILNCSLVCKRWCNFAKSSILWQHIYNIKEYPKKATCLPWYVYYCYFTTNYFKNMIKNGNGQHLLEHWHIERNGGHEFKIEDSPQGCGPLPLGVPEFQGHKSCFVTSYELCKKYQKIEISPKCLMYYIIQKYKPHIYVSEWFCGRFDCACYYKLAVVANVGSLNEKKAATWTKFVNAHIAQWANPEWEKFFNIGGICMDRLS